MPFIYAFFMRSTHTKCRITLTLWLIVLIQDFSNIFVKKIIIRWNNEQNKILIYESNMIMNLLSMNINIFVNIFNRLSISGNIVYFKIRFNTKIWLKKLIKESTYAGFRSRWINLFLWRNSIPFNICKVHEWMSSSLNLVEVTRFSSIWSSNVPSFILFKF